MDQSTLTAVDALIASFEKDTYTEKHVESLLNYLVELNSDEDLETIAAITKVLGFCTKDFVKTPIIATLKREKLSSKIKTALLTSCWESGLDYSAYIEVFVDALLGGDELTAIEAYTVMTEMTSHHPAFKKAIEEIAKTDQQRYSPAHRVLINDSLHHLIDLHKTNL